jgi:hypothetical protein
MRPQRKERGYGKSLTCDNAVTCGARSYERDPDTEEVIGSKQT